MDTAKRTSDDRLHYLQRGPAADILRLLQRHGPMSTKQLRVALGVSSLNAVREQLTSLTAAGLVQTSTLRQGAGRPTHLYALSSKAQALFPQGYDVLLKLLLAELADHTSQEQLQAILAGVSTRLAAHYGGQSAGQALQERLAQLARMSDERGTPITIVEKGNAVVLHEYSCPYFNVAQDTPNVCELEQQMLAQVLGRPVRLAKRIVDGHAGCEFVVDDGMVNQLSPTSNEAL
ncbi:MAG: TrmB family transcriptional regulator [Chloroflexota bacterium]|nr:TrmB family transcriptional regulator [Chloroflexota bacterium]